MITFKSTPPLALVAACYRPTDGPVGGVPPPGCRHRLTFAAVRPSRAPKASAPFPHHCPCSPANPTPLRSHLSTRYLFSFALPPPHHPVMITHVKMHAFLIAPQSRRIEIRRNLTNERREVKKESGKSISGAFLTKNSCVRDFVCLDALVVEASFNEVCCPSFIFPFRVFQGNCLALANIPTTTSKEFYAVPLPP